MGPQGLIFSSQHPTRDTQKHWILNWPLYGVGMGFGLEGYSETLEAELATILYYRGWAWMDFQGLWRLSWQI